tara:strand:+ start:1642 stop:1884 length:243 start_codon:yes stop_codon:yes gene_type:complete
MEFRSSSPVAGRAREFGGDDVGERQENGEREGETETERETGRETDSARPAWCFAGTCPWGRLMTDEREREQRRATLLQEV